MAETRYFTGVNTTVNGLSGLSFQTTTGSTMAADIAYSETPITVYMGIKVWKRDSGGTETPISTGDVKAIVSGSNTANLNATWECPGIALAATDSIVVRVYGDIFTPPTTLLTYCNFTTQQLGGVSLDASTWTVSYRLTRRLVEGQYIYSFYWGTTYISYVENFTWTSGSSIKTINGLAKASIKTVNGLAIASVKTWNGLT